MGCITSKQAVSVTPAFDYSGALRDNGSEILASSLRNRTGLSSESKKKNKNKNRNKNKNKNKKKNKEESSCIDDVYDDDDDDDNRNESRREKSISGDSSLSLRLGNLHKYVEGEHVAAGWPAWLSAVAGEAIQGWVPLRADSFEKLEKIGQGTYSSVFRARDLDTGRIVALKKVRFDNFEPESVRFMAREILILRRLDHPNIIKLEGIVTSRLSCSIYLVFEYMEHDLAGLSSSPDIKFSEAQVKCYMQQLLSGIEHCHSRGIMHRDIKGSNLLVSNDGILKVADFGLANFCSAGYKQPLTSRVVTLWYRPPELLLGSTDYGATVDIWSVGCVFAELFLGKPILQGRTEVEQLHKIFKLCGSPPDEYWKKSRLPHATIFKPQHPYESCLRETCNELPTTAVKLIHTLLSVEPYKRGNASSALASEYFSTRPYACDPSTLPKYPPNKEIDAKSREEARKRARGRGLEGTRRIPKTSKVLREPNGQVKYIAPTEEPQVNNQVANKINGVNGHLPKEDADAKLCPEPSKPSAHKVQEPSHVKNAASQGDIPFSGPLDMMPSSGFSWVKKRKEDVPSIRSYSRSSSKSQVSSALDPSNVLQVKNISDSKCQENGDVFYDTQDDLKHQNSYEVAKHVLQKQWTTHLERPDSFDASDGYQPLALSGQLYQKGGKAAQKHNVGYQDEGERVEYSGPLLSQSHRVDELLEKHERHIRRTVRKSWFQRGKKHEK